MAFDKVTKVFAFDGQVIWLDKGISIYEVGNFLGGGAAGS